jgi:hypothetical protein
MPCLEAIDRIAHGKQRVQPHINALSDGGDSVSCKAKHADVALHASALAFFS